MAPTVLSPESCPTTVPVWSSVVRRSLVTIGVTADSRAPGMRMVSEATMSSSGGAHSAAIRSAAGVSATTAPDPPKADPMSCRGSVRSDRRPPAQEPRAIAASAIPMTRVLVSSVRPRYGASKRKAVISTTNTAADEKATSAAAARGPKIGGCEVRGCSSGGEIGPVTCPSSQTRAS